MGVKSDLLVVTKLSKLKTALQMTSVGIVLGGNLDYLEFLSLTIVGIVMLWLAAIITVITGVDYFRKFLDNIKGLGYKRIRLIWKNYNSLYELNNDSINNVYNKTKIPISIIKKIRNKIKIRNENE